MPQSTNPMSDESPFGTAWGQLLDSELTSPQMLELRRNLQQELHTHTVYPAMKNLFAAYKATDPQRIKVIILGQDPYHNGIATGHAFDCGDSPKISPSLRHILKEVVADVGETQIQGGNLAPWVDQQVFLLNTVLTVRAGEANSHADLGWHRFISRTLTELSFRASDTPIVALLWGKSAQKYSHYFTRPNHLVLEAPHPAAEVYSGGQAGFFGCKHFSKANEFLTQNGEDAVSW